ncbi:MAG: PQQ-like beta-propeller repeat protein [Pirellulaceae bacterium]|nr:PQQ-like beta-propeller repeat protein [Pirellulaceae bacterium]
MNPSFSLCVVWFALSGVVATASDWSRFRGPAGSGVAVDSDSLPTAWSPTENLAWKTPLPGPGASSPIIVGDKVLVTCYSGYGTTQATRRDIDNLTRHLVCVDLQTGRVIWQTDVPASLPEDSYYGTGVSSHGYASHTPVSDGNNVYAFFGKGGVYAFDLDGKQLWRADAGKESDPPRWGSSSSPVLYKDTVIVTASAESQSIIGFDKTTGQVLWRQEAKGLDGMWGTPTLVKVDDQRTDLVMLVAKELWGLDPANGELRWHASATSSQQAYTSVIKHGSRVYAFSGQGGGSIAVNAGGSGDISDTHTLWTGTVNATYASPVRHRSKLYVVSRGVLSVVDADSGDRVQQIRLKGARETGNARFGSLDYASPVIAGDRLFYLNASGQVYVFGLYEKVKNLAVNQVTTAKEIFWGSPAVSDSRMILRSSKHLYCIADKGQTSAPIHQDVTESDVADAQRTTARSSSHPRRRVDEQLMDSDSLLQKIRGDRPRPDRPQRPISAVR